MIHNLGFSDNGWKDLRVPAHAVKVPASSGPDLIKFRDDGSGSQGIYSLGFDNTSEEEVYMALQMPHDWIQGSDVYPHVHWSDVTAGTQNERVCWGLEYTIQDEGAVIPLTTIILGNTVEDWSSGDLIIQYHHYTTPIGSGIDMSGITGTSAIILCRLFRNVSGSGGDLDDFGEDAVMLEFDIHYEANKIGTSEKHS